ncbi:3-dehydroquinate synthase [Saccharobesus litoralis]|uniref:3-dehydroquinate synthase n=1 Tax=Saccharobesus litoralis TaxID=2172099 RepID=A0A2S0VXQ1_9ALTE|nr:3-dehydroquinate synthase [Saccharobesus litoralis]AWB68973.1 3-dehydroquinate synthase [Saccharobesus litoralis]
MTQLNVELGARSYPIRIGSGLLANKQEFANAIPTKRVVVVTNETVQPLYLDTVLASLSDFDTNYFVLPDGEQYKTLEYFEKVNAFLLENNYGRDTTLVALGGGVIGDLVGFVSACYQRGVPFVQVPTTLLSQVDSSVGGKTAVNHALGKNMIGAFKQPVAVLIDTDTLKTLPKREFAAGAAEVLKYGLICDKPFWQYLIANRQAIQSLAEDETKYILQKCCQIKADVVAQDETEKGVRALLNLGHTFGHAIEAELGYGQWLHGEAVGAGMVIAAEVSLNRGYLNQQEFDEIKSAIAAYDLPIAQPESMSMADFVKHMKRDKKVENNVMRFILPSELGQSAIYDDVTEEELAKVL